MTSSEFNKKWAEFLEEGHYGLALDKPEVVEYLDKEFEILSKLPDFKFSQIIIIGKFFKILYWGF